MQNFGEDDYDCDYIRVEIRFFSSRKSQFNYVDSDRTLKVRIIIKKAFWTETKIRTPANSRASNQNFYSC